VRAFRDAGPRPLRVGLAGGQGTGKSTLARRIEGAGRSIGLATCVLALDDYYLTRAERRDLARRIHPLFETRGAPGTHDVARCLDHLLRLGRTGALELPVFDKGIDDRVGTRRVEGPFDLIVLEGWCVGAAAVDPADLAAPCNALERDRDPDGRWRRHANEALAHAYAALFGALDRLVFLRAPDLASIRRWRLDQEAERPPGLRMDAPAVERFVEHYERISLRMLDELPGRADWTIELDAGHRIAAIRARTRSGSHGRG